LGESLFNSEAKGNASDQSGKCRAGVFADGDIVKDSAISQISNHWRQNAVANSLILWYILYQFSNP